MMTDAEVIASTPSEKRTEAVRVRTMRQSGNLMKPPPADPLRMRVLLSYVSNSPFLPGRDLSGRVMVAEAARWPLGPPAGSVCSGPASPARSSDPRFAAPPGTLLLLRQRLDRPDPERVAGDVPPDPGPRAHRNLMISRIEAVLKAVSPTAARCPGVIGGTTALPRCRPPAPNPGFSARRSGRGTGPFRFLPDPSC